MLGLEAVVFVGVAILVANVVARRFRIANPVVLLVAGVLLGFIPSLRETQIPPELVLLVLLPVLLYWESLTTSLREIRANLTVIAILATVLVVATAGAVAVIAHASGLGWGAAWVLGAAVAPTDATATAALGRLFPRQQLTVLRAESLINDGTALVVFGVAVGVTVGEETLTAGGVAWSVVLAYVGGAAMGIVVASINIWLRRRLDEALLGNLVMFLAPFAAFLLAELIGASGVVAVVVSGLIMSQVAPRIIRAQHRTQALASWPLFTFIINAALFVFVGIELQQLSRTLDDRELMRALALIVALSLAAIAVRAVFVLATAGGTAAVHALRGRRQRRSSVRPLVMNVFAGFRGAISLAVALSVPATLGDGSPFPDRDLIIFVTAGVVVVTLVGQAIIVQLIAKPGPAPTATDEPAEVDRAALTAFRNARAAIPELARRLGTGPVATSWVEQQYDTYLGDAAARVGEDKDPDVVRNRREYVQLNLALIAQRREQVIQMRDDRTIDDAALRSLQASLDAEELSLSAPQAPED